MAPVDLGSEAARYRQHARVAVQTRDLASGGDAVRSRPGKHPSPTADIEHTISRGHLCGINHVRCPPAKDGRDKALLVDFGRIARYLPAFGLCHGFLPGGESTLSPFSV